MSLKQRLTKYAIYFSVAYVVLVPTSYIAGGQLPEFRSDGLVRDTSCYWTNAMVWFVECGSEVSFGAVPELFYNLSLYFWFIPMLGIPALMEGEVIFFVIVFIQTLVLHAPILFLIYVLYRRWRMNQDSRVTPKNDG